MSEPCCEANSYGFKCMCSAYRNLQQEEDDGRGDYDRDAERDRIDDILDSN